ncbi:MAG: hypothetical protein PHX21_05745 [bacterium]|nr:hypothetical protein [bacterium]
MNLDWIVSKIKIAEQLNSGECNGGYPEGIIILCSIINAISSNLWPNSEEHKQVDKKRFIELLVKYSDATLNANFISLRILYQDKIDNGDFDSADLLLNYFPLLNSNEYFSRILAGQDIDKADTDIKAILPSLLLKDIRKYSYACLFYTQVRCGYFHEYNLNGLADDYPMSTREVPVSYTNQLVTKSGKKIHRIYFSFDWVKQIIISVLEKKTIIDTLDKNKTLPYPDKWWIEG